MSEPKRAAPEAAGFTPGDTVLGNFKGFGDWDEALVMGVNPDGTYTLEYTDEGLVEEGVPPSRIRPMDSDSAVSAGDGSGNGGGGNGGTGGNGGGVGGGGGYSAGETVLGNFKGLGDWDEAIIVGKSPDGTYVLEYTDEGLVEVGVPADRIAPMGGADAEASALMASDGRFDGMSREEVAREEEVSEEAEEEEEEEAAADVAEGCTNRWA